MHLSKFHRYLLVAVMLLLAATAADAQTSKRIKQLQQQSTTLKKQIADAEKLLRTTRKDVNSQLSNLAIINGQIDQQRQIVDGYQQEVDSLHRSIGVLQGQTDSLAADLAACKQKYRRALLYMNRNRLLQNKWGFILMSRNFHQLYRRMRYAANYSKYLRAQGLTIKKKEEALRAHRRQLDLSHREKNQALASARQQHNSLEQQKSQRQSVVDQLNKKQKQLDRTIAQQRKQYATLNANIERLIQQEIAAAEARRKKAEAARRAAEERKRKEEEARRRREAAAAARSSKGKTASAGKAPAKSADRPAAPRYEEEDAADRTLSSGFSANRGRLPVPISGSYAVTSRYGHYNVEGLKGVQLESKGVNFTGRPGAKARCVYNGEVSTVANIGGTYIVIVRHGSYFSVYSNLSAVSVRQGQQVSTRQTLGSVAADAAGNCTLHFQLRQKNGRTAAHINPLPWIAR